MQVNPIISKGILYGVSSTVQAFALDAATGKKYGDLEIQLKTGLVPLEG